jgi:hypothetical protein
VREEMKLYKITTWLTLASIVFLLTLGIASAQNPIPIGTFYQTTPFDSNPTADSIVAVTAATRPLAYDGELLTAGNVYPSLTTATTASWTFSGFTSSPALFAIGWVDLKLKMHFPTATTDDSYRIEYSMNNGVTWVVLQPTVSAAATKFNSDGVAQTRSWAKITDTVDGVWDWDDMSALQVRVVFTKGGSAWDGATRKFYVYELWATVFEAGTLPPTGTSVSVQAPVTEARTTLDYATDYFYIEIVARQVTNFAGWQFTLDFDTNVLTPVDYVTYYPMTDIAVADLNDAAGYVSLAMSIPITDPLALTGITGEQFAIARIFFTIDDNPANPGMGEPAGTFSPLALRPSPTTIIVDVTGAQIPYTSHSGTYGEGAVPEFPLGMGLIILLAPLAPIAYLWRTRRKVIKK